MQILKKHNAYKGFTMKTKKTRLKKSSKESGAKNPQPRVKSYDAYGDKVTICANAGCALRKKAKCYGFEGCPGFKTK